MLHWVPIILGGILALLLAFYAYLVICSLIENTGRPVFSIIIGGCHAATPMVFLFFGWKCFLRVFPRFGLPLALLGVVVCLLLYLAVMVAWEKLVLGEVPEIWVMGLITAGQLAITGGFIYGFIYF